MKVVLIDDHTLFREGLSGLLERRAIEVISCSNADEGLRAITKNKPDVVLLDLRMPDMDGISALQRLRKTNTNVPVAVLTTSADANDLSACLQAEANGYLLKDMEPDEFVRALRKIVAGEVVIAPELSTVLASIVQNNHPDIQGESKSLFDSLTPRELEILCHLAEGQSNKTIARQLDISDGTVKLHVKAILRKLKIRSRVEAAVMAVEEGICSRSQ